MSLIVAQKCCCPGGKNNEDYVYQSEHCLIVLDGSTNLFGLDRKIDARWYVKTFVEQFNLLDNGSAPLLEVLKETVQKMKELYVSITGKNPDDVELKTSASIALVVERKGMLHFYSLGDCSIVIDFASTQKAKELIHVGDVSKLDKLVIKRMFELHNETGIDVIKARGLEEIQKMLLLNRCKMNKPNGYWILGFDEEAIEHGVYKTYSISEVKRVIMFSDGFNYQKQAILDNDSFNVEELYIELRKHEHKDKECNNFPRLKTSDDATIIVAKVACL